MNKKERNELIAKRIRKFRKDKGLTQKQLGELIGMNESQVRYYELGKASPKLETVERICKGLGISLYQLYDDDSMKLWDELENTLKEDFSPQEYFDLKHKNIKEITDKEGRK